MSAGVFQPLPYGSASVQLWTALAHTFGHAWPARIGEQRIRAYALTDLDEAVRGAGDPYGIGITTTFPWTSARWSGDMTQHTTRSGRVTWALTTASGIGLFEVLRPAAAGASPTAVIRFELDGYSDTGIVRVDTELVQTADYYARHVNEAKRILDALATVPAEHGGISRRQAAVCTAIIAAGAAGRPPAIRRDVPASAR